MRWRLRPRDPALFALSLFLCVYYATTQGIFQGKASGDGYLGFLYLPGLVFHRSFDLALAAPEYVGILGREVTGHVANPCPIGPLIFWAPPYLLGLAVRKVLWLLGASKLLPAAASAALLSAAPGGRLEPHGPFDYWMAGLGSLFAGILGIYVLHRLLRRHLPEAASRVGVACAILGTPLCWYLVTQPLYQHAVSFLAVTLFIERWDAWRRPAAPVAGPVGAPAPLSPRRAAMLGALAGYMMLVRVQEGVFLLLPGLDVLAAIVAALRGPRPLPERAAAALRAAAPGALLVLVAALCFLPQLALWRWDYGTLRAPQAPGHMRWANPALLETLCSMRAGLLPWSPLLYLALPGLLVGRRALGGLAWRLALLFLIEWYVNAAAWDYHGSWGFGPRRFTDATIVWAAGVGGLYAACRPRWRPLLGAALVALCLWNLCLTDLLRRRRIKNSAVGAFRTSQWVRWAGGPPWLERLADRVGYPFAWPAALAYSLLYRMPLTQFEGLIGNYILERDWRIRSFILTPGFAFADRPAYVVSGVAAPPTGGWPEGAQVPAGPELRLVIPLSAREPVRLRLLGDFAQRNREVEVRWNGERLPQEPAQGPGVISVLVPERLTHARARLNELVFSRLPPGTRLSRMDFQSFTEWWKPRPAAPSPLRPR